jgi:hypothetical protein
VEAQNGILEGLQTSGRKSDNFEEQDSDPHYSEKLDQKPHFIEKLDPDPH